MILHIFVIPLLNVILGQPLSPPNSNSTGLKADQTTINQQLSTLLLALKNEKDETVASALAGEIESVWRQQGGPTATLLLQRIAQATKLADNRTIERSLYHLRKLEPNFAQGWIETARVAIRNSEWDYAIESLTRALELDENRFDAWSLLGSTFERANEAKAALDAYSQAIKIHPFHPVSVSAHRRLTAKFAGKLL